MLYRANQFLEITLILERISEDVLFYFHFQIFCITLSPSNALQIFVLEEETLQICEW